MVQAMKVRGDAPASLEDELMSTLRDAITVARRGVAEDPVELAMARTITVLERAGSSRPSDVAAATGLDLSTVSRQLKALESRGWIAREPDPSDGRAHLLSLSDEGRRVLRRQGGEIAMYATWPGDLNRN